MQPITGGNLMKRIIITLVLVTALLSPNIAMANISNLIPPFHWTYHSLSNLSAKGLIGEQVVPGKSSLTPEQVPSARLEHRIYHSRTTCRVHACLSHRQNGFLRHQEPSYLQWNLAGSGDLK